MDFLNTFLNSGLGEQLKSGAIGGIIDSLDQQFNLPDNLVLAVKNLAAKMTPEQMSSLSNGIMSLKGGDTTAAMQSFQGLGQELPTEGILDWFQGLAQNQSPNPEETGAELLQAAKEKDGDLPDFDLGDIMKFFGK
jgi:hypothetical protein